MRIRSRARTLRKSPRGLRAALAALALGALVGLVPAGAVAGAAVGSAAVAPQPPDASFTYAPTSPLTGQSVSFDGSGSSDPDGTITSYAWDFGDGAVASTPKVTHTFTRPGSYAVQLTVTDNSGSTGTFTRTISVAAPLSVPAATLGSGGTILVRNGTATFVVACPAAAQAMCQGTLTIVTASKVAVPGKRKPAPRRRLALGSGLYTLDPGASEKVGVRVSAAGLKLLAHGRHLSVVARLVDTGTTQDSVGKTATTTRTVTLALARRR